MAFIKRTILETQELIYGGRYVGQVIPILSGKLDKVSLYVEPKFETNPGALNLILDVYNVDTNDYPYGSPIVSKSRPVSEIQGNGIFNMPVDSTVPSKVAIVARLDGGDSNNAVALRYVGGIDASNEPLLVSISAGSSWTKDLNRKLTYIAYSFVNNVDSYAQTATIQPALPLSKTDASAADFEQQELKGTVVQGDTVVIDFGNLFITLIIDQSGSMTWNDRSGVRFDFLKDYIDDIESILPVGSTASYYVVKFNGRKIARMRLLLQEDAGSPSAIAGIRIVRKAGALPVTGPTDGIVIYEGLSEALLDKNLATGTQYQYGAFAYNMSGVFSYVKNSFATPTTDTVSPMGVANLKAVEQVVKNGDYDIGKRKIKITWFHPQIIDSFLTYDRIVLVKRADRFPENVDDGTVLLDIPEGDPNYNGPYFDFNDPGPVTDQSLYAVANQTYYYAMFTKKPSGTICSIGNSRRSKVTITPCNRFWEKLEPPFNNPALYGFDPTPPSAPINLTTNSGDSEIVIAWNSGSSDTKRYELWFKEDEPVSFESETGDILEPDGNLIYNGPETSFTHRSLENGQPNFYMLIAYDSVSNQSSEISFTERSIEQTVSTVIPESPLVFSAEPYNSTANRLEWKLPISDEKTYTGWFGDTIKAVCAVTFEDESPTMYTGVLKIQELSRKVVNIIDGEQIPIEETPETPAVSTIQIGDTVINPLDVVFPSKAMDFAIEQSASNTIVSSIFSANPLISVQNSMQSVEVSFKGILEIRNRTTGVLLTGIDTETGKITLINPLTVKISNDPSQEINVMAWDPSCNLDKSPIMEIKPETGVYVQTGDSFNVLIELSFRGKPILENVSVFFRILDKGTGAVSTVCKMPNQNNEGVSTFTVTPQTDEVLDRTGQPTGESITVSKVELQVPSQDVPGEYILEVTTSYLGYRKIEKLPMRFAPSLNIDMDLFPFEANGQNIAEQKAFVYFGDPSGESKIPVPDDTVISWEIKPLDIISQLNLKKRPFYSMAGLSGSGVKSATKSGVAKQIFFGPGTDIGVVSDDPAVQAQFEQKREISSCITDGELYEISATAKVSGMIATGYGIILLTRQSEPEGAKQLNRIFLRKVDNFNKDQIYADGSEYSEWEVVAKPEDDGTITDLHSGAYFRERITALGGLVPSLEDDKIITLTTKIFHGIPGGQRILVETNLTETGGRAGYAKARIENGVARFKLRLNSVVSGVVKENPLAGESGAGGNIIYGSTDTVTWEQSALIYSLTAYTILEVDGKQITFYGGGSSIFNHTPPCYLSFKEPLGRDRDTSGGEP